MQAIEPLPDMVCATGAPIASASFCRASCASDRWMPPPTMMTGRFDFASSFAARSISSAAGRMRRDGAFSVNGSM